MMNNQYNAANLTTTQPHGIQIGQHVTTSPTQSSAAVLNTLYAQNQQQQHHHHHHQQQQQQLAAAVAAAGGSIYSDHRQLHLNAATNALDKTYYAATPTGLGTPQRFYTTSPGAPIGGANTAGHVAGHPNTILITNNFAHNQAQSQSGEQQRLAGLNPANIRIVTSSANPTALASSSTTGAYQQAQHVFNLNNTKALQQLFPQHILQQQQTNFQHTPELIHFGAQHFPTSQNAASSIQMPQYYVASETAVSQLNANPKMLGSIPANTVTAAAGGNPASSSSSSVNVVGGAANGNGSSTVVLDRINICINNLYTDTSSSSASNSLASTPAQQPSPIIPAIQHKAIIDNGQLVTTGGDIYESSVLVIDEPDSTTTATTPHTPPTTPENTPPSMATSAVATNNNTITTTSSITSPSTSSCGMQQQDIEISNAITTTKPNFAVVAKNIEEAAVQNSASVLPKSFSPTSAVKHSSTPSSQIAPALPTSTPLTPPTPPSPETSNTKQSTITCPSAMKSPPSPPAKPLFANGEDVFIKRQDGRFYLGTVMDNERNQFLVRFDDKTEQWCNSDEMRKLGGGGSSNSSSTTNETTRTQPMCLSCKQLNPEWQVEICERCGRGYHRKCTKETAVNSGIWLCKRCDKPMKLSSLSDDDDDDDGEMDVCRQLSYNVDSLTWDSKHRVNEEQIYCYCGKFGKFDHNMLQCCRCLNWYHTQCTHKFRGTLLRGDSFFVFSCTVCNGGEEYLRRLQLDWVDLVHLIIYNLSTMKKHQNHKYHHLLKDIYPFAIEKRKILPIPEEWISMPENDFLNKIKSTLKENTERFVCGKEIKRDHYFFALRSNGPPISKPIAIKPGVLLNDDFVVNHLKLKLLSGAPENADVRLSNITDINNTPTSKPKCHEDSSSRDIYAFDDTSDDEIPIKLILDKVKKKNKSTDNLQELTTPTSNKSLEMIIDVEDDNANDIVLTQQPQEYDSLSRSILTVAKTENKLSTETESKPLKSSSETTTDENNPSLDNDATTNNRNIDSTKRSEKSSRKRKVFTLNKSYDKQRLFDSSSDENSSSSSRGTSLDLIIPPPKNFLGQNNPFRMITPKKKNPDSSPSASASSGGKKSVSFGIFNTNGLKFGSKLAAFKSSGLFPNLSTSNLAKAAGQPRTVRTIKRRLSAKDITIGPNQEVRRRRTRRLSANVEVISTTTINPIPTNFFPIHAKDLLAAAAESTTTAASLFTTQSKTTFTSPSTSVSTTTLTANGNTSATSLPTHKQETMTNAGAAPSTTVDTKPVVPTHGRRLRQRPPKCSPNTSRRSSVSSNQSSTSSSTSATPQHQTQNAHQSHEDLKQTVNKYFGIVNRIESGEQFSIRAKRQLANGQMQYLIEWGEQQLQPATQHVAAEAASQINADLEIKQTSEMEINLMDNLKEIQQQSTE